MVDPQDLDGIPHRMRHRKEIIIEFHKVKSMVNHPKREWVVQKVAKNLGYTLDQKHSNSHVRKVIKEWFNQ